MDANLSSYKFLKAKSFSKKRSVFDFDRTMEGLSQTLLPGQESSAREADSRDSQMEDMASEYDKKLQLIEKSQDKRMGEMSEASQNEIKRLSTQIQKGDEQNLELSESLKEAIERLSSRKQQENGGEKSSQEEEEEAPSQQTQQAAYDDGMEMPTYSAPGVAEVAAEDTKPTAVQRVAKKAVNIDDVIAVGENKYRITNLFGQRSGKNAVSGVSSSEHSRGLDLVGYSKDGKVSNLPIALTDGEILSINVQGSGDPIHPKTGRAAGYYMNVKMADGKVMKYMHLGEDAWNNKAKLVGKKISRGDLLYEGDYSRGSGSQTSPHIKVSITSLDDAGKELRNFSDPENDPTPYALYGNYVEQY